MQGRGSALAMAALVLAMALWGSSFIALKLAFAELPALWVIAGRMLLGALVFLAAWRWRGRVDYRRGDWKYLLALTACEPCLYFIFEALALQHTSASQAGMITALLPLLVALGAYLFLHERLTRTTLAGFVLALGGALWLSLAGSADEHAPNPLLGNFFELLAILCATAYTLLLKHLTGRYSPFILTALQALVGSLFFVPLAAWQADWPSSFSPQGLAAVAYLGVVVTVGAYGLFNFGVSRLPASQATAFTNLIPLFTLVFAAVLLGERLSAEQMVAAGLVFVGVLLSQWRSRAPLPAGVLD
ncbi:DMT family transporter [Ectopseudomonas hydrolytica]|uniref:DMT family transporter n=1 Tax=Ectopseudomonas hydrolytica TaxID=2493633 RepID=UPI0018A6FEF2|nr:DMT family transporter [Pseudomonas hydrolytica]MBF8163315.1 DMT family transporter [Pseudomonas mendocina]UTH30300.1 DMT family transporter [Pseudomonas hydrolytica]UZZ09305.1 DMT family transporter [Pseudomonas mendocina]